MLCVICGKEIDIERVYVIATEMWQEKELVQSIALHRECFFNAIIEARKKEKEDEEIGFSSF